MMKSGATSARASASVSEAYDAVAADYDRQLEGDTWMRRILWKWYIDAFRPGDHVLDLGCGTGTDAVFLAQRGVRVTGVDISPAMIAQAERKVARHGLTNQIQLAVLDVNDVASLLQTEEAETTQFDGIISSFAALNTVPTLRRFAADASYLLKPDGRMILHLLNGSSVWEWASLVAHRRWAEVQTLSGRRKGTFRVGGRPVQHYMPRADEAYARYFAHHFRLCRACGLGITRPSVQLEDTRSGSVQLASLPEAVLTALGRLDELIGAHRPFVNWGRFVVVEMANGGSERATDM